MFPVLSLSLSSLYQSLKSTVLEWNWPSSLLLYLMGKEREREKDEGKMQIQPFHFFFLLFFFSRLDDSLMMIMSEEDENWEPCIKLAFLTCDWRTDVHNSIKYFFPTFRPTVTSFG